MHNPRFDLEKALAAWRRSLTYNFAFTEEDLDELAQHVRDQVAGLMAEGLGEEAAFRQAMREMGDHGTAEGEYGKVYWGKRRRQGAVLRELQWRFSMLANYFKIAWRNLLRQKGYSFLNVTGLAVGLACAFLIVVWIGDEVRYDRFHEDGDRIYRVRRHVQFGGDQIYTQESVPWPLARALEEDYPEVEEVVLTTWSEPFIVDRGERSARENGLYASPGFFDLFSWGLIQGDPAEVLQDPASVVLSVSLAETYFGAGWRERAVGGMIRINDGEDFTVTGVFEDLPRHSSLQFDFVLPMDAYVRHQNDANLNNWSNSSLLLYLRLREGVDGAVLSEKIAHLQNDHIEGFRSDLFLQPYTDQHLYSTFENGVLVVSRTEYYIRMFAVVALMIVLIACINFVNLATARSMGRAREIGVRKAIGAERRSLVGQFMGESLLLVFVACVLAMGLVAAALPAFNTLTEKGLTLADLGGTTLLVFAGIGVLTALAAGTYPAFYLSSFDTIRILRGTFRLTGGAPRLRKGLVVFQFAMSILLIVGTITVYRQVHYIHSKNLGLDRENVIVLPLEGRMRAQFDTVKEELLRRPGIAAVTAANASPLDITNSTHSVSWPGKSTDNETEFHILSVNFDFLETLNMELAEGRDFDPGFGSDSVRYIINEKARDVLGFAEPLGQRLSFWGGSGTIVGVVRDFHMVSLYAEIAPTIIQLRPQETGQLLVRTESGRTQEALARLESVYSRFNPEYPFAYQFLDERFRQTYRSETVIGKLAGFFTAFALFIACLGLFGLAAFTARQRTKEIGVRKVLGASVPGLVALLSKDFLGLVGLAFVVAAPVAYVGMQRWLEGFAYRIALSGWTFLLAGLAVLVIAMLTVSYQAIKAALADPVESLRYE